MKKLSNWKYKLEVMGVTVQSPVRMEGTISFGSNNSTTAVFNLYNLSSSNRAKIYFQPAKQFMYDEYRPIALYVAKDGESFVEVFKGTVLEAYSYTNGGQVGITTHIQAVFSDVWWARSSHTFSAGTSKRDAINVIMKDMPNITLGEIGNIEGNFLTDTTFDGNSFEQLQKITGGNCFIHNDKLYIVNVNECVYTGLHEISSDTTLLGTPILKGGFYQVKSIFIPELYSQQRLTLKSHLFPAFDGDYRVTGFTHTFVFDEVEGGTKTTDLCLTTIDAQPNQDIVTTTGTTKTDEGNYMCLASDKAKYELQNGERNQVNSQIGGNIQQVYNYIQLHDGQPPAGSKITANISWTEMLHPSGSGNSYSDIKKEAKMDKLANCVAIAKMLQKSKDTYFPNVTLKINSGFRTRANNNSIKGASSSSWHLQGGAIDWQIPNNPMETRRIYFSYIKPFWNGEYGYNNGYIHVGLGIRKKCYSV